jgi:hypothetical protein
MKFFTTILSALALAVSTTSANPIDPRGHTSFPLSIMERRGFYPHYPLGFRVPMAWNTSLFTGPNLHQFFGDVYLEDLSSPSCCLWTCKLFSLPHLWLNWENLICVRPPHLVLLVKDVDMSEGNVAANIPMDMQTGTNNLFAMCSKSPS